MRHALQNRLPTAALAVAALAGVTWFHARSGYADDQWAALERFFQVPKEYEDDFGTYRSPLLFEDGRKVESAKEWPARRAEILALWHKRMGAWPPLIEEPHVKELERERRGDFTQV